ncbi:MAG TPA: PPC domain-containing protein, partial [Kofleriaceae bacterium]|nr:PPC domain-containing protein [Kofleriaceae bacterium]
MRLAKFITPALAALVAAGCAADELEIGPEDVTKPGDGKWDSSVEAVFVDMEFDAVLFTTSSWNPRQTIQDQMLYTIGHLNGERSVGRLDRLTLTDIQTRSVAGGVEISYHARLPVAWGRRQSVPSTYTFTLPRDVSFSGLDSFTEKYMHSCVDWGAHDVDAGSMWYYYRPERSGFSMDAADVVEVTAAVSVSSINTTGKYPEYHKVWEDDVLEVVAIFGKYEDFATSNGDAGIAAYNEFIGSMKDELRPLGATTIPADIPFNPGVELPDITFSAELPDGKRIQIVALLVDNVRTPPAGFDQRYAALSQTADVIAYNGHAGLGANIRALARKGSWVPGQYVIVFMNGCDTYAYVDGALAEAHAAVNPDDPNGTKYMDIVTNAMPAFFHETANSTRAIVRALMQPEQPITYEKIFTSIDRSQVVLVSGEQDNEFVPGGGGGGEGEENWGGLERAGIVARNQEIRAATPVLAPGTYRFEIEGTSDADLYVRVGEEPTVSLYDCRPYRAGSSEVCEVDLGAPAVIHVMVRGWASSSSFTLTGSKL